MKELKNQKVEVGVVETKEEKQIIEEQQEVLRNTKKNMLVSASAGSGKTHIMIEYISNLICERNVSVNNLLVLTFTKAAATEMKERLLKQLKSKGNDAFVLEQIDALSTANICTIDAFCEKCLKKYANLVGLSAGFEILDENYSQKLSLEAFEKTIKTFYASNEEECLFLLSNFKNDKNKIREILLEIDNLLQSLADKEAFVKKNLDDSDVYFNKALGFLFESSKRRIVCALEDCEKINVFDFYLALKEQADIILSAKTLGEMCEMFKAFKFPRRPNKEQIGEKAFAGLEAVKKMIANVKDDLQKLKLDDLENVEKQKEAKLEKVLLKFFGIYQEELSKIKRNLNVLTFADLEFYMKKLSEKENLFSSVKYVFIDEYQDTNKIQEKIVKNVAKNCNFVAVGDAKQGIYGFRNASAEIFLKDMEEFSLNEDSQVNCLKSNFRSSQKVLGFVNDVCKVCMTKQTTGIDYLATSMLEGRSKFVDEPAKAVYIDLVEEDEEKEIPLPYLYSVKQDCNKKKNKFEKKLKDVKRRIVEVMSSKISDKGVLRDCRYSDITILARTRDDFFDELAIYLQQNGVPVISNSKNNMFDEPEIKVLVDCLKIALNMEDDISLLSVLISPLGGMSFEKIANEKSGEKGTLCELVKKDKNEVFSKFNKNLEKFKENIVFFGIKHAFLQFFNETNYRAYLNLHEQNEKLNLFVDKFLEEISASGFDNDLSGLVDYFSNIQISVSTESTIEDDAILLTTIHNSKGLEYPIVFLIGCEKDLMKDPYKKGYVEINEEFGFSVKNYDSLTNKENVTIKMQAINKREQEKKFAEELMIFYVALTRAKNRLYLFGDFKKSIFEKQNILSCKTYFDFVFFALPKAKELLLEKDFYETDTIEIVKIENVVEEQSVAKEIYGKITNDPKLVKQMEEYLNFKYDFEQSDNFRLKESVTSLNNKNKEDILQKYSNQEISFSGAGVEIGNAYHLALKILPFGKIGNMQELLAELENNKELLGDAEEFLDKETLLKNILLLKKFVETGKVVKEKEFIMKDKLSNLLDGCQVDEEVIVQGVVDFFVVQEDEIVLVDYKYSNSNSEEYLLNTYKGQIKLYKGALENFFNLPVKNAYLLSLKNSKLIEVK
ncbi:MAG: UvrD-helicase domain-containing protein [Clostridia bacterium]|nr:UvrD-helicase domain-containing protein [Clostridia bacterium]